MRKVIALFLVLFGFTLFPTPLLAATLTLNPENGIYNKSCKYSVKVDLDTTNSQVEEIVALLTFDPNHLRISSISNGTIFQDYPGNTVDSKEGKIKIQASSTATVGYKGKGTVATINFQVLADAPNTTTLVPFDFDVNNPTKTTDSNVIEKNTNKDILTKVTNGAYRLETGPCPSGQAVSTNATPKPSIQAQVLGASTLPDSALSDNTLMIIKLGVLFSVAGLIGFIVLNQFEKRKS